MILRSNQFITSAVGSIASSSDVELFLQECLVEFYIRPSSGGVIRVDVADELGSWNVFRTSSGAFSSGFAVHCYGIKISETGGSGSINYTVKQIK